MKIIVDNFFTILLIMDILLSFIIVFRKRKETAQTWTWVLVLMFIPVVGFILYILLGRGISRGRIFDLKIQGKTGKSLEIGGDKQALVWGLYPHPSTGQMDVKQLIYMLTVLESTLYTAKDEVTLSTDGCEKFNALIGDIKQAKDHVHFRYYTYRSDTLGEEVRDALIEAARRGVKVRVLLDVWSSTQISSSFFQNLKGTGGEVAFSFPLFVPYINPRISYRDRRKIIVIDGKIGYTGGFGVGSEYLGLIKKFGYWRDNHLHIYGEAVYTLQNRFLMDWSSQYTKEVGYSPKFFPSIHSTGDIAVQIVISGPDTEHEQIKVVYLKIISLAKREILIQTPCYIPDGSIHEALKSAPLSGVKVHIQMPNKPDHLLIYWAAYSFAVELVEYRARIETYENGFIHAKTMIIDDGIVSVGLANTGVRSFHLDLEVNTLIYDGRMVSRVRKAFFEDSRISTHLTKEMCKNRGIIIKMKEGLARLISPLLWNIKKAREPSTDGGLVSFSNRAISENMSEMEKASHMSEINLGVSLISWGKREIS